MALIELVRELLTHPTLIQFLAWLIQHLDVTQYLLTHPVVRELVRDYFGI